MYIKNFWRIFWINIFSIINKSIDYFLKDSKDPYKKDNNKFKYFIALESIATYKNVIDSYKLLCDNYREKLKKN